MGKRIIIWSIVIIAIGFGATKCYQSVFYEYISVVNFANESESTILIDQAIQLDLYCHLQEGGNFSSFDINFKFSEIKKEALLQNLDVQIVSIDQNDPFLLDHVLGHKDTINAENFDNSHVNAKRFELLPSFAKRISVNRDFNGLTFHFRTEVKPLSKKYRLKIKGDLIIDGKKIHLEKELKMIRTKEWVKIQMMT